MWVGFCNQVMVPTDQKADPPANNKNFSHLMAFDLGLPAPFQRAFQLKHQAVPSCPAAQRHAAPSIHESIPYNKSLPTHTAY